MFFTKVQKKQVTTIVLLALVILGITYVYGRVVEGFTKSAEQYVSGNGPFRYTLADLKEMAGGKSKLKAIEFYDYYEDKKSGKKGFLLQDAPEVGMQNETGGPKITFGNNQVVYAENSTRTPKFPIALTDSKMASGIVITNVTGTLGGNTEPPLFKVDNKKQKVAVTQFTRGDKSTEEPGKGQELKIKFIFTD